MITKSTRLKAGKLPTTQNQFALKSATTELGTNADKNYFILTKPYVDYANVDANYVDQN